MKALTGTVTSTKTTHTATVLVETRWQHPLYKKTIKRTKKYLTHNTLGAKDNDVVEIKPVKPVSKRKRFAITKIISSTK